MPVHTTVPITIQPDAAARVAELGMQAELDRMIQYTCDVVPNLERVALVLEPPYDTGDEPYLTIEAYRSDAWTRDDETESEWGSWKVNTFPPDVCRHFAMLVFYRNADAG